MLLALLDFSGFLMKAQGEAKYVTCWRRLGIAFILETSSLALVLD